MKSLKIVGAALAALVMFGCCDKKDAACDKETAASCCDKKDAACEQIPDARQIGPRFSAQAAGVVLLEPQAIVKAALKLFDEVKGALPEEQVKATEAHITLAKKLGVEDIAWVALSGDTSSGAGAFSYDRPLADLVKGLVEVTGQAAEKIDVAGADAAYQSDDSFFAQVGKVVLVAGNRADLEAQIKLYSGSYAVPAAFADVGTSTTGLLTVKVMSLGKIVSAFGEVESILHQSLPDGERLLKECGTLTLRLTTEGASIALACGSEADALTIKTVLDSYIAMAKREYESEKDENIESLPPAVKDQLPALDAALKSLACTQEGKVVTLSVKVEILKLAAVLLPVLLG